MHMKYSHTLKISRLAAFLCVAVFLCACSKEIGTGGDDSNGEDGGFTTVTLAVNPVTGEHTLTTKGMTTDQENAIRTLYILAFQPDVTGGTYRLKYYVTGKLVTGGGNGQFSFSLRRSLAGTADTKLLLIANQNPFAQVNTDMTYGEAQTVLVKGESGTGSAFADTGIPMFGFAGNSPDIPLEITEGMRLRANLLRAVTRVDVGVGTYQDASGTWDKGNVKFDLTAVYVFKPQSAYSLLPVIDNLHYDDAGMPSVTAASPVGTLSTVNFAYTGTAITNNTYCKAGIYIPEVAFNGGTVYDENHEARTALVVGGLYKGKTNYYRIDFTAARTNTEGTALIDVFRNNIYRYSISSVTLPGYPTPEAAYSGKPAGLTFTVGITDWVAGKNSSPSPDMVVRMNYGGINGIITKGEMKENGQSKIFTIQKKIEAFTTDDGKVKPALWYNNLLGEAKDNTYNGTGNGGIYKGVADVFKREGPYGTLVIAPDNVEGAVVWKTGTTKPDRVLVAKKACWDYRGQGLSDWRLPRLSELCLLWLNKKTINQSKGFTSLGESSVTYWSATEGKDDKVYAVNAAGEISLREKTEACSIRCVREVR